ncbi:MAG: PIN domain-containing protein, partial [bacterium]
MLRAVIDTNLFVTGLMSKTGAASKLIDLWEERAFDVLISEEI